MRKIYLKLKIYDHRLKTLAKENGFEEFPELFSRMYEELCAPEAVVYYEYNYPARNYMTAVLCPGDLTEFNIESCKNTGSFNAERAVKVLGDELLKEAFRLIGENVKRAQLGAMQAPEYIEGEDLENLKESLPDFPEQAFSSGAAFPFKTVVFKAGLGRRIGCSGGGACTQCTHPTCGKAYNG